jgi:hypothetical protein
MGTRSNIVRENEDGSFDSIYCHWDGYPSNNGKILLDHYTDQAKIDQLLQLGDLSSLGPEIGEKHDFDKPPEGQCNFYGRDRGEKKVKKQHFRNAQALAGMLKDSWTEWVYVFRVKDGKWYYTNNPSPTWFKLCGKDQKETAELTAEACLSE